MGAVVVITSYHPQVPILSNFTSQTLKLSLPIHSLSHSFKSTLKLIVWSLSTNSTWYMNSSLPPVLGRSIPMFPNTAIQLVITLPFKSTLFHMYFQLSNSSFISSYLKRSLLDAHDQTPSDAFFYAFF